MKPLLAALFLLLAPLPGLLPGQYARHGPRAAGSNKGASSTAIPPVEMRGKLREIDKKKIIIDAGEDQILTFNRSRKTKFFKGEKEIQPDDFPDGARVTVEANRALNGDYDAVDVFLGEPPAAKEQPATPADPAH